MTDGAPSPRYQVATLDQIRSGRITDVYFQRTLEIIAARGLDRPVRAEFFVKTLPDNWNWAVLAGVEEALSVLEGLPVDVRCLAEGTVFRPYQPIMEISGSYASFAMLETALLGFLCQASGIATRAARCKRLAGDRIVASFGARRMHPAIAPMIERNAYLGGCDGVSVVAAAELVGEEPMGTMPHALILMIGDTLDAVRAFDEVIGPEVRRVALIDTFNDEKFEAVRIAEAMGERLFAVRLDTPASRRGDFRRIIEEVRWELALRGLGHVRIFVSGGLTEDSIRQLNPVVDAYGVGGEIAGAAPVDFSMDIVEIEGEPKAKRGKWSGSKSLWRCPVCFEDRVTPRGRRPDHPGCSGDMADLMAPLVEQGRIVGAEPPVREIRRFVMDQVARLDV
ncbi:MAG: nicotinate phosphoribosyltransferase [Chloroflexi bacterium]|nr:nicotinate phosphoribosyltransferase [Chloroflexota bacterium]